MAHEKDRIFGEWMVDSSLPEVEHADRILGAQLLHDSAGRPEWIEIQWASADEHYCHRLQLDFLNGLFLLSLLKSIQLESGVSFPDDPRAR